MQYKNPLLSFVICTYRRPQFLSRVLESLSNQVVEKSLSFEVIVVENDAVPSTEVDEIVDHYKWTLPVKRVFITPPNLSDARNKGAEESQGTYIVYIDDDAVADPGYIDALQKGVIKYAPDIFCGPITPLFSSPKPKWFSDQAEYANDYGDKDKRLTDTGNITGASFGLRKDIFDQIGGFRSDLGMRGGGLGYGEETFFIRKAWSKNRNLNVMYLVKASVHHQVHPIKYRMKFYFSSAFARGRDSSNLQIIKLNRRKYIARFCWYFMKLLTSSILFVSVLFIGITIRQDYHWWQKIGYRLRNVCNYIYLSALNWGCIIKF